MRKKIEEVIIHVGGIYRCCVCMQGSLLDLYY